MTATAALDTPMRLADPGTLPRRTASAKPVSSRAADVDCDMAQQILECLVLWKVCEDTARAEETYDLLEDVLGLHAAQVTLDPDEVRRLTLRCTNLLEKLTGIPARLRADFPGDDMDQAIRNAQNALTEATSHAPIPAVVRLRRLALAASHLLDLVGAKL
ncbi:DUF6415 family natural product biosynthesis protein [Streptomyces sp. Edi2]|uniref:DUF6415 family natural product biosynthesis protein n=1 Tax=Streptomyces sp. Edi2 TaxID=3162528 RepID=UPI003305C612